MSGRLPADLQPHALPDAVDPFDVFGADGILRMWEQEDPDGYGAAVEAALASILEKRSETAAQYLAHLLDGRDWRGMTSVSELGAAVADELEGTCRRDGCPAWLNEAVANRKR